MKVYIVDHFTGSYALNEQKDLVAYEHAPKSLDDMVEEALKIERGEPTAAYLRLLDKLKEMGITTLVVETSEMARVASGRGFEVEVKPANEIARYFRGNVVEIVTSTEFVKNEEEFYKLLHEFTIETTRRKLRRAAQKRDLLAAQAIRAIDDIDKTTNLFAARLREWYSLHFPELDDLVREHEDYVKIVAELGHRDNITVENLIKLGFSEEKAKKIAEAASKSMGADYPEFDIQPMQRLARITLELYKLRRDLSDYIAQVMKEVAPNITALVGPLLGARLISLAGGLEELAYLPASTIQVLGAEKALFRALRTGGKPPKHGIIFQYPDIHRSPRWQRGKIARALAAKLAIAAKVDYFTGRFIGDKLKEALRKRIEEIKRIYKKPPKRKEIKPTKPAKPARPARGKKARKGRKGKGKGKRR
ncbi:rRNA biogenesis protein Nop56/Nop58 [Pyrodictium delaneyi]|uniref:C/D box methylation guide ribonucleoprotein complex aNOP56 subunit n=1 Tax=Pyrodictium delaneyi TaxID=1273541 RepID=A0A0P0N2W4_9CREN|nr:C/D box methylation guide ribonucleoprotein complex aNOP56 subunit [Pyrodictium delaneyi]ALL00618.1 rRNA biogenesis protein Nop56/Nop58 [Pyrodictium delaneyi]OWJ54076.1 C/D box methylation guide ribonucleoprotein complex aNOP56 subunit [Pyrodictium delaneyi]